MSDRSDKNNRNRDNRSDNRDNRDNRSGDITLHGVGKRYRVAGGTLEVLRGIDLVIPAHAITVLLGKSGCGKTTLLRLTGGLDRDYTGEILRPDCPG